MISAGDFKNGVTVEIDGNIYQILEFQHVKPGKGAAFVRTKLKNIISGGVVEKTFRPTEKFPKAHIDRKDMQYLYRDGDLFNFMDVETYDHPNSGEVPGIVSFSCPEEIKNPVLKDRGSSVASLPDSAFWFMMAKAISCPLRALR